MHTHFKRALRLAGLALLAHTTQCKPPAGSETLADAAQTTANTTVNVTEQSGSLRIAFSTSDLKIKDLKDLALSTGIKDPLIKPAAKKFFPLAKTAHRTAVTFKLYLEDGRICTPVDAKQRLKGTIGLDCKAAAPSKDSTDTPKFSSDAPTSPASGKPPHTLVRYYVEKDEIEIEAALSYTEGVSGVTFSIEDKELEAKAKKVAAGTLEVKDFALPIDLQITLKDGKIYKISNAKVGLKATEYKFDTLVTGVRP